MVVKIQTDVDRLLLDSKLKKSSILTLYIGKFVFIVKTKSSLSTSVPIFSTISQILKKKKFNFKCGQKKYQFEDWFGHVAHLEHGLKILNGF